MSTPRHQRTSGIAEAEVADQNRYRYRSILLACHKFLSERDASYVLGDNRSISRHFPRRKQELDRPEDPATSFPYDEEEEDPIDSFNPYDPDSPDDCI